MLRLRREREADGSGEPLPALGLLLQSFPHQRGEIVVLGFAIVLRGPPVRLEQTLSDESDESGVERDLLDEQPAPRDLRDAEEDPVAVEWA